MSGSARHLHRSDERALGLAALLCVLAVGMRAPGWGSLWILALVGLAALLAPQAGEVHVRLERWVAVSAMGVAAFALVGATAPLVPVAAGVVGIAASAAAAVAEEIVFRRLLYGLLLRWGAVFAVLGSAAAFALVHVPGYGWWALPLDLAAGVLFGWQRWATGTWTSPALTHLTANLIILGGSS